MTSSTTSATSWVSAGRVCARLLVFACLPLAACSTAPSGTLCPTYGTSSIRSGPDPAVPLFGVTGEAFELSFNALESSDCAPTPAQAQVSVIDEATQPVAFTSDYSASGHDARVIVTFTPTHSGYHHIDVSFTPVGGHFGADVLVGVPPPAPLMTVPLECKYAARLNSGTIVCDGQAFTADGGLGGSLSVSDLSSSGDALWSSDGRRLFRYVERDAGVLELAQSSGAIFNAETPHLLFRGEDAIALLSTDAYVFAVDAGTLEVKAHLGSTFGPSQFAATTAEGFASSVEIQDAPLLCRFAIDTDAGTISQLPGPCVDLSYAGGDGVGFFNYGDEFGASLEYVTLNDAGTLSIVNRIPLPAGFTLLASAYFSRLDLRWRPWFHIDSTVDIGALPMVVEGQPVFARFKAPDYTGDTGNTGDLAWYRDQGQTTFFPVSVKASR